jgi:hypothetical protein
LDFFVKNTEVGGVYKKLAVTNGTIDEMMYKLI